MSDLSLRTKTAVIYGGTILLVFALGRYWTPIFSLLFALITIQGLRELLPLLAQKGYALERGPVYGLGLSFLSLNLLLGLSPHSITSSDLSRPELRSQLLAVVGIAIVFFLLMLIGIGLIGFFAQVLRRGPQQLPSALMGLFSGIYLAFPFAAALIMLYLLPQGWVWLLLAFVTPWFTDTVAYLFGSRYGCKKIFPKLSPNKTGGGFWAAQLATALLYLPIFMSLSKSPNTWTFWHILLALFSGFTIALADQFGDLFASALKRYLGVKDFGQLFPGHGGVLDRFDSTFYTIPVCLIWALLMTSLTL